MALAELVQKLRTKKQAATKTAFSHYLEAVKKLASGSEVDADEVGHVLDVADKTEADLERDVNLQQQRLAWHAQRIQNQQAVSDRLQAERELQAAQQRLQEAYDKLTPAIKQAQNRLDDANYRFATSMNAEEWLSGNLLDVELLEREAFLNGRLREINTELRPLLQDQVRRQTTLGNLQSHVEKLREHASIPWLPLKVLGLQQTDSAIKSTDARIAAVRDELQQLQEAIRPRQQEQQRLQAELAKIHSEKLLP